MKEVKTFICCVDIHRRPSRMRNTHGRYYVGAKTEKEAKELLQKAIGFGSITIIGIQRDPRLYHCKYKEMAKEEGCYEEQFKIKAVPVRHATDPILKKELVDTYTNQSGKIFKTGDVVKHKVFGVGKIISITPFDCDALLEINFDRAGPKKFSANHMKFEIL